MEKIKGDEFKRSKNINIFSTGFIDADSVLGNVEKGSIITIGARPSMGKTAFALGILMYLAEKNKKCFYFSLDLSKERLVKRMLEIKSEIPIIHRDFIKEGDWKKITKSMEFLADSEIYIEDKTNLTVDDIEEKIKNQEVKPDIVFIDHIQLLKMPKAPNFTDSINLAVQEIKRIAKETGMIFIILTSLSRALEQRCDKRPLLSDIRNSSLLEELSDVVMMIYREEYYNREDETLNNIAEIIFRKNDFGPLATVSLKFEKCAFYNMPKVLDF